MEYMDDIKMRIIQADQTFQSWVGKDIYAFIKGQAGNEGLKVMAKLGNLSEAELKAGLKGQTPPVAPPGPGANNLQPSLPSQISRAAGGYGMYIAVGLGALILYKLVFKKRRG